MTEAEKKALEADFNSELYPGATTSPQSLVNVLVSDNPTESIKSSVLTNPEAACVDVPSTCEPPWFYPNDTVSYVQPYPGYEVPCIAHFGLTKANEDKCEDEGGQTIYFTKDGNEGYLMGYMMSSGELSYVGNSSFWYNNLFIDNVSYSIDGEPMNDLYNFIYGYQYNLSGFDPNKKWCAYAENSYGYYDGITYGPFDYFNYTLVDCETSPIEAERICFRFPNSCSNETLTGPTGPTGPAGRKKRQAQEEEGSLDIVFLPSKQVERENIAKQARASYATNFRKMNLQKSYPSLFEILWYTQLPCFDVEGVTSDRNGQYGMLKACYWKGYSVPCSKIFTTFPTDQGMCCTFNMESAERMFQEGKYQDMVMSMQTRDRNLSFDRNSQLPPDWYNDQEPISEAGRSKGLQVLLDAHSNMVSGGTVPEDFDGFYAIIDDKNQFPMTTRKSVLIRPGHNNFVSIGATTIDAAESLIDIEQDKRNCLFPTEMEMSVHKNYSQANCLLECQLDYAVSMMNVSDPCLPWYFPINDKDNARLCDPWEAREFRGNAFFHSMTMTSCTF